MSDVVLAITGSVATLGIARYVLRLTEVLERPPVLMMSEAAARFVNPSALGSIVGTDVVTEAWPERRAATNGAAIGNAAKVIAIAPATAATIARCAIGLTDTLVSWTFACCSGVRIVAPAMNRAMYRSPAVVRNLDVLTADGVRVLPPSEGYEIASGTMQPTGMCGPDALVDAVLRSLGGDQC